MATDIASATMNYHNEHEPKTAAWLRCLIEDGLLPPGHVDERTIEDVTPTDLKGYTQCHFFAGIGGWPHALDLAGWRNRPCWTGSPPCQPFSRAGEKQGVDDARHLWPTLRRLIGKCNPPVFFGEQVASKDTVEWIDRVGDEMENLGYAFGAAGLPACGVGLYQRRRRWYFVAYAASFQAGAKKPSQRGEGVREAQQERDEPHRRVSVHEGWKDRVSEPGIPLVVDGFPGIVDAISGAGNAICPPLAVEFIKAADLHSPLNSLLSQPASE